MDDGTGSGSFRGFQDANKNKFLAYYLPTVGTFTSVFKDNKSLRSHKTRFYKIFCFLMEGAGPVHIITDPDPYPGGPKTYGFYGTGSGSRTL
jgi:hypothetical protein